MPRVIYEIANDQERNEMINRQRMGIRIEDAATWGLDYSTLEDGMTFLTLEAYTHPYTINLFKNMLDSYKWWKNAQFVSFKANQAVINDPSLAGIPGVSTLPELAFACEKD